MRAFFILLLVANAAFFAWQYQARGGLADRDYTPEDFQSTDPGVPPLMLLVERAAPPAVTPAPATEAESLPLAAPAAEEPLAVQEEAADAGQPAAEAETEQLIVAAPQADAASTPVAEQPFRPETQAAPAMAPHCYELGPSADRDAIEQAAAAARQAGARAGIRESTKTVPGGYSVRLPENYSISDARARYRELQRLGIDDIAIVPLPDKGYFISLGVYKRKDTVEERRQEIMAKGVTPVIEDRTHAETFYTLAVEYEGADPASLQGKLAAQVPQAALQEVACQR